MPTILTQLGYTAAHAQLMTVPIYAVACSLTFATGLLSDRIGKRSPAIIIGLSIALIGLILLYTLPKDRLAGVRYFGCVLFMSGAYSAFPGTLSWVCKSSSFCRVMCFRRRLTGSKQLRVAREAQCRYRVPNDHCVACK
jgi:MFS family permease